LRSLEVGVTEERADAGRAASASEDAGLKVGATGVGTTRAESAGSASGDAGLKAGATGDESGRVASRSTAEAVIRAVTRSMRSDERVVVEETAEAAGDSNCGTKVGSRTERSRRMWSRTTQGTSSQVGW